MLRVLAFLVASLGLASLFAAPASAATYSQQQTLPVPPASSFAGTAGGDGWDISLSQTQVFNVFHHGNVMTVACLKQADATTCPGWPRTVTEPFTGRHFASPGHSGTYFDQVSKRLYVYGTRVPDNTSGVVCVDTLVVAGNPFCGFTALSLPGQGQTSGWSMAGLPMQVGTRLYAFNFVWNTPAGGVGGLGTQNKVMCFDLSTAAACAGQPYSVDIGAGNVQAVAPSPATGAIGSRLMIPINTGGTSRLACFDTNTQATCNGAWPVSSGVPFPGGDGSPFPKLDGAGAITGVCLPSGADPCWNLAGASVATPPGMSSVITNSEPWNGQAVVIGPRVYVPNGAANGFSGAVQCYDYSTSANCTGFPKTFANLSYLYTVNVDPQRPTCLWVNADNGSAQIQSFDAFSKGACGSGSTRVLTSQFIVPREQCYPTSYQSLQVISPARAAYVSGTVEFADGAGNPIPGMPAKAIDANGMVDLTDLENTPSGLPQFLITLNGAAGIGQLTLELTWTDEYDPACVGPNTEVDPAATALTTSLTGDGQSGPEITVQEGSTATDTSDLTGANADAAGGSVTYTWYSDDDCTTTVSARSPRPITTPGTMPDSEPVLFGPGTYYPVASYSGDEGNLASASSCGDEVLTVAPDNGPPTADPITGATTVDEGSTHAYSVDASDPDGDTLTYAWTVTGGNATISGSASGSSVDVVFSDGPSAVTLQVQVDDGQGETVTRTLEIDEQNVAPTATLDSSNPSSGPESLAERTFSYAISDPGDDTVSSVSTSCGSAGTKVAGSDENTDSAGSFRCVFANGPATSTVSVDATDSDGDTGTTDEQTFTVTDPGISAEGVTFTKVEEEPFTGQKVASFSDPTQYSTAGEYAATIDWGDGSSSAGQVVQTGPGEFDVTGSYTYLEENTSPGYTVTVTITDVDNADNSATATSTAFVTDAAIHATGTNIVTPPAFSGTVATFTDDGNGPLSDFTATIDWGDGSAPTAGTITGPDADGTFTVSGSHTYPATGPYTVTVKVDSVEGSTDTALTTVLVYAFATGNGGSFTISDKRAVQGATVTFWGAQWDKLNPFASGAAAPSSFKGFIDAPASHAAPACGADWTTAPGNSSGPPATVPAYMAVVVASRASKSGSTISGDTKRVVVVKTNPGYGPSPGHAGTGRVVASVC